MPETGDERTRRRRIVPHNFAGPGAEYRFGPRSPPPSIQVKCARRNLWLTLEDYMGVRF